MLIKKSIKIKNHLIQLKKQSTWYKFILLKFNIAIYVQKKDLSIKLNCEYKAKTVIVIEKAPVASKNYYFNLVLNNYLNLL